MGTYGNPLAAGAHDSEDNRQGTHNVMEGTEGQQEGWHGKQREFTEHFDKQSISHLLSLPR